MYLTTGDIDYMKSLVIRAGDTAQGMQDEGVEVTRKPDTSIVTRADLTVQDMLIEGITSRFSEVVCIHEENAAEPPGEIDDEGFYAIIDPIDGTAMYSMYLPVWCVSVGIVRGGVPLHGFVYSPGFKMMFFNDGESSYLNERPIRAVMNDIIDSETNLFYASEVFHDFTINFPGKVRNLGSTALQACLTTDNARNRTLGFVGRSHVWDWAGAIPIVQKAGGKISYLEKGKVSLLDSMRKNYELPDYCLVYNHDDFETMRCMFKRK